MIKKLEAEISQMKQKSKEDDERLKKVEKGEVQIKNSVKSVDKEVKSDEVELRELIKKLYAEMAQMKQKSKEDAERLKKVE